MITIKQINQADYPDGKPMLYEYVSHKYYDIVLQTDDKGWSLTFKACSFKEPFHKKMMITIFEDHMEQVECYIAQEGQQELGIISLSYESWHNTVRLNDIHIAQEFQGKGIGGLLMQYAKERAVKMGARALVLETQTSNYPAIQFYKKHGFELIGSDLISYSNQDVENKEVRIELGLLLT